MSTQKRKLPDGWAVREPIAPDKWWRIVHRGEVLDGRRTEGAARRRAWDLIDRRDRARKAYPRMG